MAIVLVTLVTDLPLRKSAEAEKGLKAFHAVIVRQLGRKRNRRKELHWYTDFGPRCGGRRGCVREFWQFSTSRYELAKLGHE